MSSPDVERLAALISELEDMCRRARQLREEMDATRRFREQQYNMRRVGKSSTLDSGVSGSADRTTTTIE